MKVHRQSLCVVPKGQTVRDLKEENVGEAKGRNREKGWRTKVRALTQLGANERQTAGTDIPVEALTHSVCPKLRSISCQSEVKSWLDPRRPGYSAAVAFVQEDSSHFPLCERWLPYTLSTRVMKSGSTCIHFGISMQNNISEETRHFNKKATFFESKNKIYPIVMEYFTHFHQDVFSSPLNTSYLKTRDWIHQPPEVAGLGSLTRAFMQPPHSF